MNASRRNLLVAAGAAVGSDQKATRSPGTTERLTGDAAQAVGGTPAHLAQFIAQEHGRWKKVVERAKIKPE